MRQHSPCKGFLPITEWEPFLASHPDQQFAAFLRRGITHGFRIGFNRATNLHRMEGNLRSVQQNPEVVDKYIKSEVLAGKLIVTQSGDNIHCSPIGIIPKPHQPGKFRLIVDLSSPHGHSINEGISPQRCSLEYASVETAVRLVQLHGKGALMAKLDLKSAYRMVPVHSEDQHLLGIQWREKIHLDQALPFGLRSAPKLFTAVADGLTWAMVQEGITDVIHYLDDFFFCGPAGTATCGKALNTALPLCERLGFPVAPEKVMGPTTVLIFLGIEIDSVRQELRLPREKLERMKTLINNWAQKRSTTKHELQCLLGHLNHACTVVKPGRTFMHNLITLLKLPKHPTHKVRLNIQCRADIAWWQLFLPLWNGSSYFSNNRATIQVFSDASGSWGGAALEVATGKWFQIQWPHTWKGTNIAIKELVPVIAAAAIWGPQWEGSKVCFNVDNMAVVAALNNNRARDPHLAHLLRCLFFFEAHYKFEHQSTHIPGKLNTAADALSRNRTSTFHSVFPQAQTLPSQVPLQLVMLMTDPSLTWTSERWKKMFRDILFRGWPNPH